MKTKKSKNVNNAKIDANGNVILGDNNTVINLKEASEYRELIQKLEELDNLLKINTANIIAHPDIEYFKEERLRISKEQNKATQNIELLKQEVLKLAEEFSKISINSERLRIAKMHFESGAFEKARTVLDAEMLTNELDQLLKQKQQLEREILENEKNLKNKSNEFLILAILTSINFEQQNRFELASTYFDKSITAEKNASNTFDYALFLQLHNFSAKAIPLYEESIRLNKSFKANPYREENIGSALNNLSLLYMNLNDVSKAKLAAEEAIQINESITKDDTEGYKSLAASYSNLAKIYSILNKVDLARELVEKSMHIYEQFQGHENNKYAYEFILLLQNSAAFYKQSRKFDEAKTRFKQAQAMANRNVEMDPNVFLPLLAQIEYNLAELFHSENNNYEGEISCHHSLGIFRSLSEKNPYSFLPKVALTTGLLADIYSAQDFFAKSESLYKEALVIYKVLAKENPAYLHDIANTLNNLGTLYLEKQENELAETIFNEALNLYRDLAKTNPDTFLPEVSTTLNNLAINYKRQNNLIKAKELYDESLQIARKLATENFTISRPGLATTLSGIASLLDDMNFQENAEAAYQEALEIRRDLANSNPDVFLLKVALTAVNFSLFYLMNNREKLKSLDLAKESFIASIPFINRAPEAKSYMSNAWKIISDWGEDPRLILPLTGLR